MMTQDKIRFHRFSKNRGVRIQYGCPQVVWLVHAEAGPACEKASPTQIVSRGRGTDRSREIMLIYNIGLACGEQDVRQTM